MAITPAPGYMIDPNNPNGVIPIAGYNPNNPNAPGNAAVLAQSNPQPSAQPVTNIGPLGADGNPLPTGGTKTQPTPQPTYAPPASQGTPAASSYTPLTPDQQSQLQPQSSPTTIQSTQATPPQSNLQPGSQGQDVAALQNYLVQQGYLTPEQVSTGQGTYGPQTTAAVAKLQHDLGLNPTTGQGYYGPQTQAALAQKYQGIFQSTSGTTVPANSAAAQNLIAAQNAALSQPSTDPVFGAMMSSLAPIMGSLQQVLANINNPALTAVSLQQEYQQLQQQYNLPSMQADLLNMQNIMTGTEQDVRDEVTKAGGFTTESQVLGITAARNKVILKQYNALSTQYQAAQTNVQNLMQYAATDQQTALQRQQATASITESMASIETQMLSMGMTMQQNAKQAVQYNVTQMGYKGLAASAAGNPSTLRYYESMLGLAPGSLSDPAIVAQLDTYKDQTLQLNNYKAAIAAYNAGFGGSPPGYYLPSGAPGGGGASGAAQKPPVDTSTLVRPPWLSSNVPLSLTAGQMEQYMGSNKAASVDPGTHNIVAPGIGYYVQQPDGSYVLNSALPSGIDQKYQQIKQTISSAGVFQGSPTVTRKWTLAANAALSAFKDTGTYKVMSNVAPYLAAIRAAAVNPGDKSISDFELLDSFVKAAKGGTGQVTDSQINIMLQGATIPDKYDVMLQKLQQGGVLSIPQRQALVSLAEGTYQENARAYENEYVQAAQNMQGQGIPPQFWSNLPDFATLTQ